MMLRAEDIDKLSTGKTREVYLVLYYRKQGFASELFGAGKEALLNVSDNVHNFMCFGVSRTQPRIVQNGATLFFVTISEHEYACVNQP